VYRSARNCTKYPECCAERRRPSPWHGETPPTEIDRSALPPARPDEVRHAPAPQQQHKQNAAPTPTDQKQLSAQLINSDEARDKNLQ